MNETNMECMKTCVKKCQTKKRTPCPKGTRRNLKTKQCDIIPDLSSSPNSPSKEYVKTHFDKPIKLLGGASVFQIEFSSKKQFEEYVGITEEMGMTDCFIHTLFSLGLRDRKEAKKDVETAKEKRGVHMDVQTRYIEESFGLNPGEITYEEFPIESLAEILKKKIKNNHASPITITYKDAQKRWGHSILVYKYGYKIHYFDAQARINTTKISDLNVQNAQITHFRVFKVKNYKNKESTELQTSTCQIDFAGGYKKQK